MDIRGYIDEFVRTEARYKPYSGNIENIMTGGKAYSLNSMPGYEDSAFLPESIKMSVTACPHGKEMAILAYRDFVEYLRKKGVEVQVRFPEIPVENTFERLIYIAKQLHKGDAAVSELADSLWVSSRTIEEDIARLRGCRDPLQIFGRPFVINETTRDRGVLNCASTAHPLILTENLTQIIAMLKGLRYMAEDPIYTGYAEATAAEIWMQLTEAAKERIRTVFSELIPEDVSWYEGLTASSGSFLTERECSEGRSVILDCMKNDKSFFVEYMEDGMKTAFYQDCRVIPQSFDGVGVRVECRQGEKYLLLDRVLRSGYSPGELISD